MNWLLVEDFAWLVQLERQEEARRMRTRALAQGPLRPWLARLLVQAGIHLDRTSGEAAVARAASSHPTSA
ncbi:MAG: hypothetical protein IH958_06110 [Chloroflexi bacterium]|nr:hypothetical protein [Chloroflexota bacterium]